MGWLGWEQEKSQPLARVFAFTFAFPRAVREQERAGEQRQKTSDIAFNIASPSLFIQLDLVYLEFVGFPT